MNDLVQFVREGTRRVGCVVARLWHKGDTPQVTIGWSKCQVKPSKEHAAEGVKPDRYNSVSALNIAKERCLSHQYGMTLEEAKALTATNCILPDPTDPNNAAKNVQVPYICIQPIRKMADRAQRYFFKKKAAVKAKKVVVARVKKSPAKAKVAKKVKKSK